MKKDQNTTIQDLKDRLEQFKKERDWGQFHNAKDLSVAMTAEVGELMELFLWQDSDVIMDKIKNDKEFRERVGEELADVIAYVVYFALATDIDISEVLFDKFEKNAKKYPVEKSKGKATKYDKL